jgi:acetyl-CoA C-acetyltransferase
MNSDPIVIIGAARTPIGNFLGSIKDSSAIDLGAAAIKGAVERAQISPEKIDEVYMGCVLPAGLGQAPARQAAIAADLPYHTGAVTLNKVCGSGLKTVMIAHDLIKTDSLKIAVAGGMESMSNAPYLLPKARSGYRMGNNTVIDHMLYDGLENPYDKKVMGYFAEACAKDFNFSREAQDDFALTSLRRAKLATEDGTFNKEIVPIQVQTKKGEILVNMDEGPLTADPNKISLLKSAFVKDGTITAATAASISDGGAAVVLTKESIAKKFNCQPLVKIIAHTTFSQAPELFTTAPIGAIKKLLNITGWNKDDVDLFEINEAFAVVVMAAMKELNLSPQKVNIHGGATVLGHPIGASGARILVTLIYALDKYQLKRGIAAICLGGGEAVAMAIERYPAT